MSQATSKISYQKVLTPYLFFGLDVLESPVGEGPHLLKLFFLSVQYLAQVPDHLKESTKQAHWSKEMEGSRVLLEIFFCFFVFTQACKT